jgi:hypothetical protein
MTPIDRLERSLTALADRARHLSPVQQEQVADMVETIGLMLDGAHALASDDVEMQVGPLKFKLSPKDLLSKAFEKLGTKPLKIAKKP